EGAPDDESVQIHRMIPDHPITIWNGCSEKDMEDVLRSIGDAIAIGAPLYNKGTHEGYEACFRVYEGTALKYEKDAACKGVRGAFGDGLLRATSLGTFKEKAWAMRDTFDGLIAAFRRWCEQDQSCMKKFGGPPGGATGGTDLDPKSDKTRKPETKPDTKNK
ncbi:MAG TPA: hypothetical protein VFV99_25010, partial [Kofleriaceae bacterium]|nr:hypothetical protein [Kofleriaceae bacterium]